jgi:pilus assembly protein CpaF
MFGRKNVTPPGGSGTSGSTGSSPSSITVEKVHISPNPVPAPTTSVQSAVPAAPPTSRAIIKPPTVEATTPLAKYSDSNLETADYKRAKTQLIEMMLEKLDLNAVNRLPENIRRERIQTTAQSLMGEVEVPLNSAQQNLLSLQVIDEILGFGPLEALMSDPDVSDIMINTHKLIYIEKRGKLYQTDVTFTSEKHLLNVIQKIVSLVGRRVDETSPMVDARMPDGSRFNAIIPPLALDGCLVSIRKFKKNKMPLRDYVGFGSMTEDMARFLEICGKIRLNIIVSGGTGSGKTTLLNALSGHIDVGERVITIEDAAELMLHQPHVLRLETRPSNIEGHGEVTQRQLVKNALRMRPDRIILGEIRGDEVIDVLAAMNTGHEGSMATIHANNPRDCLSRIENLVGLTGLSLPIHALRQQIASAVHLIVQVARMRDGGRRITHIEEVVGIQGDIITSQTLFGYKPGPMDENGKLTGHFYCQGIRPSFYEQAEYFNLGPELAECIKPHNVN